MTVTQIPAAPLPSVIYAADGIGPYTFSFPIFADSDLIVSVAGDVVTSGYTVTGAGADGGGYVTFAVAPTVGAQIVLWRAVPAARTSQYVESAALRAAVLNSDFNRLVAMIQDLMVRVGLTVSVGRGQDVSGGLVIPALIAGRGLVVNSTATGITLSAHDPDDAWAQAASAASSAADALVAAASAAASAAATAASAAATGAGSMRHWGPITLIAGVTAYLLPEQPASAETMTVVYDGLELDYQGDSDTPMWSITDALGIGVTIQLARNVTTDGAGGTFRAGKKISGILIGALRGDALGAGSVGTREIADGATTTAKLATGAITKEKLVSDLDVSDFVTKIGITKVDTTDIAAGAVAVAGANKLTTIAPPSTDGNVFGWLNGAPAWLARSWPLGYQQLLQSPVVRSVEWAMPPMAQILADRIDIDILYPAPSSTDILFLQVATGSPATWVISGYSTHYRHIYDTTNNSGWKSEEIASNTGFPLTNSSFTPPTRWFGTTYLQRLQGNLWRLFMEASEGNANCRFMQVSGTVTLTGPITGLRIITAGTNTLAGGSVQMTARA